jgi:hypothetical protein
MVMVLITGFVAVRGLTAWRRQMVGKRRAEIAEQALVSFYAARDVFKFVRTPAILTGEGESRKPAEEPTDEPEQVRQMRDVYFIPIERLVREKELFAKMHAQRFEFSAYFGKQNISPFETILRIHNSIITNAQLLMNMAPHDAAAPLRQELMRSQGWGAAQRPDKTDREIDAAVTKIEEICEPILEGRGSGRIPS